MNAFEQAMKGLKSWAHKHVVEIFPGLALVIATIEYVMGELKDPTSREAPEVWLYVLICGITIYLAGNWWDDLLFDPLFSVPDRQAWLIKRVWRWAFAPLRWVAGLFPPAKKLKQARVRAAQALNKSRADDNDFGGLHETAARLVSLTKSWKDEIETHLERSKAARSFLFPLLLLTLFRYRFPDFPDSGWPFRESFLSRLWLWQWNAGLFCAALLAYVWLRLVHMRRLYELTTASLVEPAGDNKNYRATFLIPNAEVPYLLQPDGSELTV